MRSQLTGGVIKVEFETQSHIIFSLAKENEMLRDKVKFLEEMKIPRIINHKKGETIELPSVFPEMRLPFGSTAELKYREEYDDAVLEAKIGNIKKTKQLCYAAYFSRPRNWNDVRRLTEHIDKLKDEFIQVFFKENLDN
ncbi:hypothetical protein LCGC14_0432620 [marine sediment metagenome]|uniref:Uncharacterized protein n=1 Tax=marine sediment metagenome TaxID=412755 RepID=A0A0F9VWY2_9ZZZZ